MRPINKKTIALLLSSFAIAQLAGSTAAPAVLAAGTTGPAASVTAAAKVNPITLGAGVTAALEDVNIWTQSGGNILAYTLKITNNSGSSANLQRYFSRVVTPGGSVIPGNPVTADATKKKVPAKDSMSITYYVNIGQTTSLKGFKIAMYVWDTKTKGYLKHAGSIAVPANYSTAVELGKSLNTKMNDIPVTASADSLQLYKYAGKVYAKVGINLTNKGNKVLSDPGYSAYLVTASGTSFELALSSSQTGYKIQPQEKKSIYYLTEIPAYLKTANMKLQFTQKDETLKLELPKTSYKLPAATTPDLVVASGAVKKLVISNNTVDTRLTSASVYAEDAKAVWSFQLQLKNTGNKAVTLPVYELAVKSAKGTAFPVNSKGLSGLNLKPLETKVVPLTVEIPLEVEQSNLQLQMIEAVTAAAGTGSGPSEPSGTAETPEPSAKLIFPVAYFTIPYTLRADVHSGQEYGATNQYGSFSYSLQSLQRYPWKDDDIVIAKLRITNTQSVNLTIPELKGALKLDTDNLASTTDLLMDKESSVLAPGKSAELSLLTKIPYTDEFENVRINLSVKSDTENIPFLDLSTNSFISAIDNLKRGDTYTITGKGKNATVQESRTTVYPGSNANIVYTELLMSSGEKRQSKMARLQAYYKTADGQFYEAKVNQTDNAATPGGKQLITFWAKLPKTAATADVSMYLGTGVTGSKLSESGEEPTGFINVSSLLLTPQAVTPAANLQKIALYPYTLTVLASEGRHLEASDTVTMNMSYNLSRDNSLDSGDSEHKLILRMTDPYGQSQDKVVAFGTDLTEGNNNMFSMSFSKSLYKQMTGGTYRLTLYDEFQGERQELGSQVYTILFDMLPKPEKEEK
ncbi:hypothetical protein PAECIP111892_00625 [Paenibacillus auburnensis]|uniref:Uncharacterized protein n=1 Tax=Paenibacillus auburnensis TaxID=2905649 RepID=A0ABM9BNG9_9BACL|nr:hypothetical protein [Paenibacillus auburnensis]CAH1191382.1 hypothetical protein PAECIP111892_00625 [Paenibacillus auburnensis]